MFIDHNQVSSGVLLLTCQISHEYWTGKSRRSTHATAYPPQALGAAPADPSGNGPRCSSAHMDPHRQLAVDAILSRSSLAIIQAEAAKPSSPGSALWPQQACIGCLAGHGHSPTPAPSCPVHCSAHKRIEQQHIKRPDQAVCAVVATVAVFKHQAPAGVCS
jgi:hypothetical protein